MTDPLFDPFVKKSVNPNPPNVGTAQSGAVAANSQPGSKTLLVLRDAMGGMGFIGPFDDEQAAMDYVTDNNLNGAYWILVTDIVEP